MMSFCRLFYRSYQKKKETDNRVKCHFCNHQTITKAKKPQSELISWLLHAEFSPSWIVEPSADNDTTQRCARREWNTRSDNAAWPDQDHTAGAYRPIRHMISQLQHIWYIQFHISVNTAEKEWWRHYLDDIRDRTHGLRVTKAEIDFGHLTHQDLQRLVQFALNLRLQTPVQTRVDKTTHKLYSLLTDFALVRGWRPKKELMRLNDCQPVPLSPLQYLYLQRDKY